MLLFETPFNYSLDQEQKIQTLRNLVKNSSDLDVGCEDIFLSKFLFNTNWDVNKAYDSLRRYYDFKAAHPDWLAHHTVEYFREEFLDIKAKYLMPLPDKEGRPIVIFKSIYLLQAFLAVFLVDFFSKYPNYMRDLVEMDDLVFESLLLVPHVQQRGITVIFDLSKMTRNFLPMLSPRSSRLINEKNKILPFAQRYFHIIQSGFLTNAVSTMLMPFLSRDVKSHIFTHDCKNLKKLQEMVGYEFLPAEYGGPPNNELDIDILYNHLEKNADYLLKLQSYKKK